MNLTEAWRRVRDEWDLYEQSLRGGSPLLDLWAGVPAPVSAVATDLLAGVAGPFQLRALCADGAERLFSCPSENSPDTRLRWTRIPADRARDRNRARIPEVALEVLRAASLRWDLTGVVRVESLNVFPNRIDPFDPDTFWMMAEVSSAGGARERVSLGTAPRLRVVPGGRP